MIRILLIAALISKAPAAFNYNHCEADCRNQWGACMITKLSESDFKQTCHSKLDLCEKELEHKTQSVCIDFVSSVKGNTEIWPDFERNGRSTSSPSAVTTQSSSWTSSTAEPVNSTPVISPAADASPVATTGSTKIISITSSTKVSPAPAQSGEGSHVLIVVIGSSAVLVLALIYHLCCRRSKTRRSLNETPLKLNSRDFIEVECEKPAHPTCAQKTGPTMSVHL